MSAPCLPLLLHVNDNLQQFQMNYALLGVVDCCRENNPIFWLVTFKTSGHSLTQLASFYLYDFLFLVTDIEETTLVALFDFNPQ